MVNTAGESLRSKIITQIAGIADIARHRRDQEPGIPQTMMDSERLD